MNIFKKKSSDPETKGLQVTVNHKLINKDQAAVFTEMVKDAVKILVVGSIVAVAAGLTLNLGADFVAQKLNLP